MPRKKYLFRPMEHALASDYPSSLMPAGFAGWGAKNFKIDQRSILKRWGYDEDRDLGSGVTPYSTVLYVVKGGSRYTLYLTDSDLCSKETSSAETFSYKTTITTYTSKIKKIVGTTITIESGETPVTDGVADGDYFILDDDYQSKKEPDGHDNSALWVSIASASNAVPSITTDTTYAGTTGDWTGSPKTGYVRHVYTVPSDERWSWAIVDDKFIFTNGDTNVQYWAAANYAADLNATTAIKARYCVEYANRLFIADYGTTRDPLGIAWSKENDPTDWSDSTAGAAQLFETNDYITGLGKSGANLIIYRQDSIMIGNRTGKSTAPVIFPRHRRGVGCVAPYSIIEVGGTNVFLGRDDFYIMRGDYPESIGQRVREKFFDIVGEEEIKKTWGFLNMITNEVMWIANTSEGKLGFIYNYQNKQWYISEFAHDIIGAGRGHK